MTRSRKIIAATLWAIAIGAMVSIFAMLQSRAAHSNATQPLTDAPVAGRELPDPTPAADVTSRDLPMLFDAPQFSLTDEHGQTVTSAQLQGHPWVADFIFTQCSSLCPIMSARLSSLQPKIDAQVKLVSFSVDPDHDTPAALLAYAGQYKADLGRWIFLTGPAKTEAQIVTGMKMYFAPADGANPIQHDQHFVLIDAQGHARGVYDSNVTADIDQLVHDANLLAIAGSGGAGK